MLLTIAQYEAYIQGSILAGITQNNPALIAQCENAAREEISGYLNQRYNLATVLQDLLVYNPTAAYTVGNLVFDPALPADIYYCSADATGGTLLTDSSFFTLGDRRNPLIMQFLIEIVLFNIHKRISPQNIPAIRSIAYENAISWLEGVQRGSITPNLPSVADSTGGSTGTGSNLIDWGQSTPKMKNYW
jgi:hypothetical protein